MSQKACSPSTEQSRQNGCAKLVNDNVVWFYVLVTDLYEEVCEWLIISERVVVVMESSCYRYGKVVVIEAS